MCVAGALALLACSSRCWSLERRHVVVGRSARQEPLLAVMRVRRRTGVHARSKACRCSAGVHRSQHAWRGHTQALDVRLVDRCLLPGQVEPAPSPSMRGATRVGSRHVVDAVLSKRRVGECELHLFKASRRATFPARAVECSPGCFIARLAMVSQRCWQQCVSQALLGA